MAIRIPILTSFDPKGLRQANAQFAKLQGSIGSLGRNFAIAGAAIAGAGAIIAKNAQSLARIERITAQTESVLKSTGTTANGTAKDIANLAGSLENLTATEAETIQEGANLLLTFKNIQNQAGAGNDIFNQTTAAMVDVARAMGTNASTEAIRLGKALNDPIKGISALSRVGIQFTEDQKAQIKALQQSGDLMGAQKIILAELQSQFGGSGAAYAKTFSGQLELMGHELGTIGEEATMAVMPALQGMVGELRELIPVIGPQLKAAIESVDWKGLVTAVVDFTRFLVENATTIANSIIAIFALNTAFKAMQVVMGLVQVALAIKTWWLAKVATGMTTAAIATGAFSTALKLIPFVAIAAGIGLIIAGITETDSSYRTTTPVVTSFGQEVLKTGHDAEWAAGKYGVLTDAINGIPKNVKINVELETSSRNAALNTYLGFLGGRAAEATGGVTTPTITTPKPSDRSTTATQSPLQQIIADSKQNAKVIQKQSVLERKGLSKEVAAWVTSSNKPVKAANEAIARISKNGNKAIGNLTKAYTNSAAGQAAAAAAAASEITESFTVAYDDTADKEAAALAERERVFKSFADSVKATFAGMKNGIINAFDLTELGGSSNAITRNMEKLLVRLRAFADNVKNLATMGLNPALLQQVISAGPMGGARLAEALVMSGAGGLSALNAGYSEFGNLSSQIAQTGTESLFNQSGQQSIYNINVDGGVGSGSTIGKAIVDAIKAYERTSGAVWQGA
jgi:seryl-tRNA synthetase